MPRTKPGVATASGPTSDARSGTPGRTNMSRSAAAGAVSRASSASTRPSASRISTKAPPPSPAEKGWVTPTAKAVAIAASMALPPRSSMARPARAASFWVDTTMPRRPWAGAVPGWAASPARDVRGVKRRMGASRQAATTASTRRRERDMAGR